MTFSKCQVAIAISYTYFKDNKIMFINKTIDGKNNLCGKIVAQKRLELKISQNQLAKLLQLNGLDIDKNAIQRIEAGKRFVTDIELTILMRVLKFDIKDIFETN